MICLNCGQENDDKNKICVYCHARLKKTFAVDLVDEEEDVPVSPGNDPSIQVRTHNYLIIIAILCIAVGMAGWFLIKENMAGPRSFDLQGWIREWFDHDQGREESSLEEKNSNENGNADEASVYPETSPVTDVSREPDPVPEESSRDPVQAGQISYEDPVDEKNCPHSTYVNLDEYDHRCTRCGHLEEHIWYVENDAVYCRRCNTLKEYVPYVKPDSEDPMHQRLMTVIITGYYLNIRSGPGEEYPMLSDDSMFYRHQYVDVYEISYDGMWGRVQWNDEDGWIYLFYTNGLNEIG